MNDRYNYKDVLLRSNSKYPNLRIGNNDKAILKIFRILAGTIDCGDEYLNRHYKFRINYFELPFLNNPKQLNQSLLTTIFADDIDMLTLDNYFKNTKGNIDFYSLVQVELTKCLVAKSQKHFLEAFFFLYRILEGICFSLPLIYTSKAKDFKKSYGMLQKFFSNSQKDGELLFFKKFIVEIFKDKDFFKSTIDIDLNCIHIEELRNEYFNIYRNLCKDDFLDDETESEELKFKFIGFYEFLIELRNRYFHLLQGTWQENISSTTVLYPDLFFKPLIDNGINWIAIVIFEILIFDIENHM